MVNGVAAARKSVPPTSDLVGHFGSDDCEICPDDFGNLSGTPKVSHQTAKVSHQCPTSVPPDQMAEGAAAIEFTSKVSHLSHLNCKLPRFFMKFVRTNYREKIGRIRDSVGHWDTFSSYLSAVSSIDRGCHAHH